MKECVMCGALLPSEGGFLACKDCMEKYNTESLGKYQSTPPFAQITELPKANTELSFGAGDGQYDFLVCYRRAKPLNKFQIWMYKVCFGIRARNI